MGVGTLEALSLWGLEQITLRTMWASMIQTPAGLIRGPVPRMYYIVHFIALFPPASFDLAASVRRPTIQQDCQKYFSYVSGPLLSTLCRAHNPLSIPLPQCRFQDV